MEAKGIALGRKCDVTEVCRRLTLTASGPAEHHYANCKFLGLILQVFIDGGQIKVTNSKTGETLEYNTNGLEPEEPAQASTAVRRVT